MYFLAMVLLMYPLYSYAQFFDGMEEYPLGVTVCANRWTTMDDLCEFGIMTTDFVAYSGTQSGMVPGNGLTSAGYDLGDIIFGEWFFDFWMYVPSNKEATFSIQNSVPVFEDQSIVGNFVFNPGLATPGEGYIEDTALGQVPFTFPHDQWFRIVMGFDITAGIALAVWYMELDGIIVVPWGTAFTNEAGDLAVALGGMNFVSLNTDHLFFVDDLCLSQVDFPCTLRTQDFKRSLFTLSPNPVSERLYLSSDHAQWETVTVYSLSGSIVQQVTAATTSSIDVQALTPGIYFVEITSAYGTEVHRVVRE